MMPSPVHANTPLSLKPVAGPALGGENDQITLTPPGPHTMGRSMQADIRLPDAAISRQHVRFHADLDGSGVWTITDLGSTHGTTLNGAPLLPDSPKVLNPGDQIGIGSFLLRIQPDDQAACSTLSIAPSHDSTAQIEHVPKQELGPPAQQKLDLIIECAAQLNSAADFQALALIAVQTALQGSGYARAAMVRPPTPDGTVEIMAHRSIHNESAQSLSLSQTLIAQAAQGHFVRLTSDQPVPDSFGQSIVSLGIHSALCAPITVGDHTTALLYLDARGSEASIDPDAAAFVQAVSRIAGLAIANLDRKQLELDRSQIQAELTAAREVQRMIMPPKSGIVGPIQYELESIPGRHVAGDLFDIIPLGANPEDPQPNDPVACLLGDVTGKGLAAALTMASVQTHLRAALRYHNGDPAAAVREVNQAIYPMLTHGRFITLWLGVIHPEQRTVTFVDAGHGFAFIKRPDQPPTQIESKGLYPLGVNEDAPYFNETIGLDRGTRLILFSDGVIEQPNTQRELFGLDRALKSFEHSNTPSQDIQAIREAVLLYAGELELADDFTLASLQFVL